jgi:hypothetical protein
MGEMDEGWRLGWRAAPPRDAMEWQELGEREAGSANTDRGRNEEGEGTATEGGGVYWKKSAVLRRSSTYQGQVVGTSPMRYGDAKEGADGMLDGSPDAALDSLRRSGSPRHLKRLEVQMGHQGISKPFMTQSVNLDAPLGAREVRPAGLLAATGKAHRHAGCLHRL